MRPIVLPDAVWFGVGLIFNSTDLARILGCSTELANRAVSLMCLAELVQLALGLTPVSRRASADLTTAREGSSPANLWCWLAGPAWGRAHWRLLWRVLAQSGHHVLLNSLEMDSHFRCRQSHDRHSVAGK